MNYLTWRMSKANSKMKEFALLTTTILALLFSSSSIAQNLRYVKVGGVGNGLTWATAAGDIQQVINDAPNTGTTIIKIAAGTYFPNRAADAITVVNAAAGRKRSFVMRPNIHLFGGYPANPTGVDTAYNPGLHATILSGDHNGNDNYGITSNTVIQPTTSSTTDNSTHVVIIANQNDNGHWYTLKGLHITGGYGLNSSAQMVVNTRDILDSRGGAIAIVNSNTPLSSATNQAGYSNVLIEDCKLYKNASGKGGAIFANQNTKLNLRNNLAYYNFSASSGGAVSSYAYATNLYSNTFYGNRATDANKGGAAVAVSAYVTSHPALVKLFFNLFDQNTMGTTVFNTTDEGCDISSGADGSVISNLQIGANRLQNTTIPSNQTITTSPSTTISPEFVSPTTGNFNLKPISKLINYVVTNATDVSYNTNQVANKDLNGNNRVVGSFIDIGAFEYQLKSDINSILYVRKGATGDGSSWANAVGEFSEALFYLRMAKAGDIKFNTNIAKKSLAVYVSTGTYKPVFGEDASGIYEYRPTSVYNTFGLVDSVEYYGGFPATGNPTLADRNYATNATILSGDQSGNDNYFGFGNTLTASNLSDNSIHVVVCAGMQHNTRLNGFTITGGNASNGSQNINYKFADGSNNVVAVPSNAGSAIHVTTHYTSGAASKFYLFNCKIEKNHTTGNVNSTSFIGGAVSMEARPSRGVEIGNVSVNRNLSTSGVAGLSLNNAGTSIHDINLFSTTIAGNRSTNGITAGVKTNIARLGNLIIMGNFTSGTDSINRGLSHSSADINYSLIQGFSSVAGGNQNAFGISQADVFQSVDPTNASYLHILPSSIPKDNGNNNYVNTIAYPQDLAYNTRIIGPQPDMGAYENPCNLTAPAPIGAQTFCLGNNPTIASIPGSSSYIWYNVAAGGTPLPASTPITTSGPLYMATQSGNCISPRTTTFITVNITATPTAATSQTICKIGTVGQLTATGSLIKWYLNSTTTNVLASNEQVITNTYYVTQTLYNCESQRLPVSVTVLNPAAPTVSNSTVTFCPTSAPTVASLATYITSGTGIKWYTSATGGSALSNNQLLTAGATYYASQTISNCEGDARVALTVTLGATPAPTATSAQAFCGSATIASLVATGQSLLWYSAATGGTLLNSNTNLINGTTYYVSQTVGGCESNRTAVTVSITNPAAPTAYAQSICGFPAPTVSQLTVTSGTAPKWYTTSTGGTALPSANTLTQGTYYVSQTVNGCESNRTPVAVTITNTSAPTSSSLQSFCAITGATISNLTITGQNIKWYSSPTSTTVLANNTVLVHNTIYYASQTVNGCESSNRVAVTANIISTNAPTAAATQTFCTTNGNPTIANLIATGLSLKWYAAATGGSQLPISTPLVDGTTYYVSQTTGSCEGPRTAVQAIVNSTPVPTAINQSFCGIDDPEVGDLVATGSNIQWFYNATGGTAISSTSNLYTQQYYVSQTLNNCTSERLGVYVTVNDPDEPVADATQYFCVDANATVNDLVATGSNIQWYTTNGSLYSGSTLLVDNEYYYGTQTVNGCESQYSVEVLVNIGVIPTPTTNNTTQTFLASDSPTLADISMNESGIIWYSAPTGGNVLSNSTPLVDGTTYYAFQVSANCTSANSIGITVQVIDNTSVEENHMSSLQYFPNPTNGELNISFSSTIERVEIYNSVGQLVHEMDCQSLQVSLQLSHLVSEFYFAKVKTDKGEKLIKFIKN